MKKDKLRFKQLFEAALNLGMSSSDAAYYAEAALLIEIVQGRHDT